MFFLHNFFKKLVDVLKLIVTVLSQGNECQSITILKKKKKNNDQNRRWGLPTPRYIAIITFYKALAVVVWVALFHQKWPDKTMWTLQTTKRINGIRQVPTLHKTGFFTKLPLLPKLFINMLRFQNYLPNYTPFVYIGIKYDIIKLPLRLATMDSPNATAIPHWICQP